ncbi:MAG: hypothetical protein ABIS51_18600 [Sphingomonas sp.]
MSRFDHSLGAGDANGLPVEHVPSNFTSLTIGSLTANQAAGTDPIIPLDLDRRILVIVPPADCLLSLTPGGVGDFPLIGGVPNDLAGQLCPVNALYVVGLAAAARLPIWRA